jgi:hypothetical protein
MHRVFPVRLVMPDVDATSRLDIAARTENVIPPIFPKMNAKWGCGSDLSS